MTTSMSSRALPIAVLVFSMVFFWAWVWFAVAGGGGLTDPAEILTQGAQATADADSFHLSLTVDGRVTDADSGEPVSLDGMTVAGDLDLADDAAHLTFALPMLMGMSGEVIVIGQDMYLLTPMVDEWLHLTGEPEDGEEPSGEPPTDEEIAAKVDELLATEGVSAAKLADQPCGEDTCYHLQLSISAEALAAHDGEVPDMTDMGELGGLVPNPEFTGPVVVDLLFQQDGLWLRQVSVASEGDAGEATMTLDLSEFNTSFDISPPPADQTIEAEDFPFLQ
ncbi:MAG: LppX_LprAFG lipoprotein [Chloroflexi bacterium]|nr:MAG: LppX_LprAFG lipoprotein [Chloroflexota bacterium]